MLLSNPKRQEPILRFSILALCYILAFLPRIFSIVRYESVLHEFDPYFNYRSTKFLVDEGLENFINWFDASSWYPLGRTIGGSIYPGLMATAASVHWLLNTLCFTTDLRLVCVFLAPFFSSNTTIATYFLAKEVANGDTAVALTSAVLIAIVPAYVSRSVAGSFDNEGVAIFAMVLTFYFFVRAIKTGSLLHTSIAALSYFYMVSSWGGYIYIINLVPLYVLTLIMSGFYNDRVWIAYSGFYVLGTLLSMQIQAVGFNAVQASEHLLALLTFLLLQGYAFTSWVQQHIPKDHAAVVYAKMRTLCMALAASAVLLLVCMRVSGYRPLMTSRFMSLLDPSFASKHMPIIASVAEHQPSAWSSFFFDLHMLCFLLPAGLYKCFAKPTEASIFITLYVLSSVYFAGVMVRLVPVLAPAACIVSAMGLSGTIQAYMQQLKGGASNGKDRKQRGETGTGYDREFALVMLLGLCALLCVFVMHCTWVSAQAYSSPSIVLDAKKASGGRMIFDDFREAYSWLRMNTPENAKVLSWWDYGYQIAAMAKRATIVDNNTWNNTHIATVGLALASPEAQAHAILTMLGADYIVVMFGGMTGHTSDDVNKFLWMVRVAGGIYDGNRTIAGYSPRIQERDYLNDKGDFIVGKTAADAWHRTLLYKMSYYRFGSVVSEYGRPKGFDRVRREEIGVKDIELTTVDEVFTTSHWLVRIYKLKKPDNRS